MIFGEYFYVNFLCGARYFLLIVDNYSRCTWIYLIENKGQTIHFLKLLFSMIKTQRGKTLNRIVSMELIQRNAEDLFSSLGILHEFTCIDTPVK